MSEFLIWLLAGFFGVVFDKILLGTGKLLMIIFTLNRADLDYSDKVTRWGVIFIGGFFYLILIILLAIIN